MRIAVRWVVVTVIAALCVAGCGKKNTPQQAKAVEAPLIDKESFQSWDAPFGEISEVTVNAGSLKGKPWAGAELSDEASHTTIQVTLTGVDEFLCLDWAQKPVISPKGCYVAIWSRDEGGDSEIGVYTTHTGKLIHRLPLRKKNHDAVSFSPFDYHQSLYADFTIHNIFSGQDIVLDSCHDYRSHPKQELERVDLVVLWLDPYRVLVGGLVESFESLDPLRRPILAVYDFSGEDVKKQDLSGKLGRDESVISATLEPGHLMVKTSDGALDEYGKLEATAFYFFPAELAVRNEPMRVVEKRRD